MPRRTPIADYENRLDRLIELADELPSDPEILAHWSEYLCILLYGYLEVSVRHILSRHARSRSHPNVARYVEAQVGTFVSPTPTKLIDG